MCKPLLKAILRPKVTMAKRNPIQSRIPLIFATIVSLVSVFSCAVSTFAWFQASANAQVKTTETSTTISVSAPDPIEVGDPTLYVFNGNGDHGYPGNTPEHTFAVGDGDDEYTELEDASISISKLWPGYKATFCIAISTDDETTINQGSLKLTSYSFTNKATRKVLNAAKTGLSGSNIEIQRAINVYVGINGTGSYAVGNDVFNYNGASLANTYLIQNASVQATTVYCFYTIEFSTTSDTFYTEYVYNNSTYKVASEAQSDSGDRYFAKDPNGNSTCYENLSFSVTALALEVS